jgi:hypothetical protein
MLIPLYRRFFQRNDFDLTFFEASGSTPRKKVPPLGNPSA